MAQVAHLLSELLDKPIVEGPGLRMSGKVNLEASKISTIDAVIALDALLVEQGVFLVKADGFLKVLAREPVEGEIPSVKGDGLTYRNQPVPLARPKRKVINRTVVLPKAKD